MKTLEDIYAELDQIADAARYADYCHRHWSMFTKRQLLNVCDERGLIVKKSDKKDNILSVLEKDYIRKMEEFDARADALQVEKAAIKAQMAVQIEAKKQIQETANLALEESGIISTPMQPKPYIIREESVYMHSSETHRLERTPVFRVYEQDGTPLYLGELTVEAAAARLRRNHLVSDITVEYLQKTVRPVTIFNFQAFFKALALAISTSVLPFDVVGSENIAAYDAAIVQFEAWCRAHPACDVTPLVFGYFVEDEPMPPETLDDAIARLMDTMNEAAQSSDYPTWYEAAEELKLLQCVEDTNPTHLEVPEWARKEGSHARDSVQS